MAKKATASSPKITNKKARHRYELIEFFECGIALLGTEVKSLRQGGGSLEEAYARVRGREIWLLGFHIPPYACGSVNNHDPIRPRRLLLHKREILKIAPKVTVRGQTLVPVDVHFNERGLAKVTIALARGKKFADKRQDLKKRDAKREMERAIRRR